MTNTRPVAPVRRSRRTLIGNALRLGAAVSVLRQIGVGPRRALAASADGAERARAAFAALQARFFVDGYGVYRDFKQTHPRLTYPYASNWSFSVAARANLALVRSPGGADLQGGLKRLLAEGLERYWDPAGGAYNSEVLPPLGIGFGPECYRFYDDNAHDGLILLEYAASAGEAWALERAKAIFGSFIVGGVDAENPVMTGGIRWAQTPERSARMDRNMTSNAPSALLGFSLFQRTGERRFYDWAAGMVVWCNAYLRDATDGLFWDKVRSDGTIDPTKWSYNQGFMIGVYTKVFEITRDERFLKQAEAIARAALAYHWRNVRNGIVGLLNQDPDFNAIFFRYLVRMLAFSRDQELQEIVRQTVQAYGDVVWNTPQFHGADGLLAVPCGSTPLRMQAAMVEIYALQDG